MRKPVHNVAAQFRVNAHLLAEAEAKAERQGMSVSELLRHALRRELEAA
jgi:antitoxin component of RelBE/YafQ-DinJ toxin-antitoxin module